MATRWRSSVRRRTDAAACLGGYCGHRQGSGPPSVGRRANPCANSTVPLGEHILKRAFARADKVFFGRSAGSQSSVPASPVERCRSSGMPSARGDLSAQIGSEIGHIRTTRMRGVAVTGPPMEEGWFGLKKGHGLKFRIPPGGASRGPEGKLRVKELSQKKTVKARHCLSEGFRATFRSAFAPDGGAVPGRPDRWHLDPV